MGEAAMRGPRLPAYPPVKGPRTEAGAALLAFLLVLLVGGSYALLGDAKSLAQRAKLEESRKTSEALAEAKAALIGYAASGALSGTSRPGDLPCPDINNDGEYKQPAEGKCDNQPNRRVGRLPWKTLGLPDLRDGSGERLWYAVSSNFRKNTRTPCPVAGSLECLNSDSRGTITVRDSSSTKLHDGSSTDPYVKSGAVAVVIAPGGVLRRQQSSTSFYNQHRECPGCVTDVCTSSPPTNTPACGARNYLDHRFGWEDNEDFVDGGTNGFIQGDIRDSDGNIVVNDKILPVTYNDIMPVLEKRVVGEVLSCLRDYAKNPSNSSRYPWAANATEYPDFQADIGVRSGRVPDVNPWGGSCSLASGTWWLNWKEQVFYAVAEAYQPGIGTPACGSCLMVNPSSANPRKVVVIAAGKQLRDVQDPPGPSCSLPSPAEYNQDRLSGDKGDRRNYLECDNTIDDDAFATTSDKSLFNDVVGYLTAP